MNRFNLKHHLTQSHWMEVYTQAASRNVRLSSLVSLLLILLSNVAIGLESDRKQAITITADFAELNETAGTATYRGNVELIQGSLHINSDLIIVFTDDSQKVSKILATGTPASFAQKVEEDKPIVVAKAFDIEYQPLQRVLLLSNNAELTQGDNRFEGNIIEYNIETQILNAHSSDSVETNNIEPKQRVKMVLPPPSE